MAMSMQQIASLLCDAPPRLNIKSRKRRQAPAQPAESDLEQRLSCIPGALASRFLGGISLCQVWTLCHEGSSAQSTNGVFRTQRIGAALYDPTLAPFRQDCCDVGVPQNLAGMLATTWACGALAIVQKLNVMPSSLHPCNKLLAGGVADLISELAYIPVYDLRSQTPSVVACLEVMVAAVADSTFLANIITTASDLLSGYALSLSKPVPAPAPSATPAPAFDTPFRAVADAYEYAATSGKASPAGGAPPLAPADSGSSVDSCPAPGTPDAARPMFARPSMVRVGTRRSLELPPQRMDTC
jgi:hypothetical protein